jgi:hypothetical protein
LDRELTTTTITRAHKPTGRTRRSSASRLARACRKAARVSREDPAAGDAEDGATDGRTWSVTLASLRIGPPEVAGTRVEERLQPWVVPKIDRGAEDGEAPGPAA